MKKTFLLIIFIAYCGLAVAQVSKLDSFTKAYQKNKLDTTLIQLLLYKAGAVYLTTNVDSGMICAKQALALSRKIHNQRGEVRSLAAIATFLNISGDLPGSLRISFQALPEAIKLNEGRVTAGCYNTLGLTYGVLKDYKKSQYYYFKALAVVQRIHEYDLETTELNNISRNYLDHDVLDSALYYTNKAYALSLKVKFVKNIGYLIRNFGIIEFKKGNYQKSLDYYNKSIQSIPGHNNHYLLSENYRRMAESYQKLNKIDSCISFAKSSLNEAKLDKDIELQMKSTALLSDVYKSLNNYKEAYDYQQMMVDAQNSLFSQDKTLQMQNLTFDEDQRNQEIEAAKVAYQNKVRFYALFAILSLFILIAFILLYNNRRKKKANELLQQRNEQIESQHKALEKTLNELKTTQTQLVQSEKMASLGELTAGIAHEIQNPLNFVNNFSEVNAELIDEMSQEISKGNFEEVKLIAANIKENEQKIGMHGKRADGIVKSMLQHSRASSSAKEPTDINALADEYLRLSYHGLRAKDKNFNSATVTNLDSSLPKVNAVPQDIGRVLLNLFNNAFYAVAEKKKAAGTNYEPTVTVSTKKSTGNIEVTVRDNGMGIPQKILDKIYQPFFTTKPTGQGTGLGLSMSYDIIKAHGGELKVNTKEGEFTEFTIILPLN